MFDLKLQKDDGWIVLMASPCGILDKSRLNMKRYVEFDPNLLKKGSMIEINNSLCCSAVEDYQSLIEPSIFVQDFNYVPTQPLRSITKSHISQKTKEASMLSQPSAQPSVLTSDNYESIGDMKLKIVQQNAEIRQLQKQRDNLINQKSAPLLNVENPDDQLDISTAKVISKYLNKRIQPDIDTNEKLATFLLKEYGTKEAAYAAIKMSADIPKI